MFVEVQKYFTQVPDGITMVYDTRPRIYAVCLPYEFCSALPVYPRVIPKATSQTVRPPCVQLLYLRGASYVGIAIQCGNAVVVQPRPKASTYDYDGFFYIEMTEQGSYCAMSFYHIPENASLPASSRSTFLLVVYKTVIWTGGKRAGCALGTPPSSRPKACEWRNPARKSASSRSRQGRVHAQPSPPLLPAVLLDIIPRV